MLQLGPHLVSGHFNTLAPDTDVQLRWPLNNSYSISIDLKVVKSPEANATIFWGHQFTFSNGENGFIAFGIGGTPKVSTFGVFDAATASTTNPTGACNSGISFLKTGNGYQCFIIYNWNIGFNYGLVVSRLTDVGGNEQWRGRILDYSTNSTSIIGDIVVPSNYKQLTATSSTWNEYLTAGSCETTPTTVMFSHPYALNTAGNHAPTAAQVTYGTNVCQDSNVTYLGGGAYQADSGRNVIRTTVPGTWLWTQEPTSTSQNTQPTTTIATQTNMTQTSSSSSLNSGGTTTTTAASPALSQTQTTSSNTVPPSNPIPGYPLESIFTGLIAGLLAIGVLRHRKHNRPEIVEVSAVVKT